VCPSSNAQHRADVVARLTDDVIPRLPVRQWVLSVPNRLRPFLQQTPAVAIGVLTLVIRALSAALRDAGPGAPATVRDAQLGPSSFPQRCGGSLNPHYHCHYHYHYHYQALALDGVVSGDIEHGARFQEATSLEARDADPVAPPDRSDETGLSGPTPRSRSSRRRWAQLLTRI
jgi:hypothetical protein